MTASFDYGIAFSRNIGWVTEAEQAGLRIRRIAIAGLGGVGGSHLLTLTRLGIGQFNIADLDVFELANFNRQAGASLRHIGRPKVEVLAEMALDINPELDLRMFPHGVSADNLDNFLEGVDLYVDGLDFFAVTARRQVFAACAARGIPAITAAPLGMGAALLNFLPGKMSFEAYFRLEGQPEDEQLLRFLLGLSPAMLQMGYLVDPTRVDLANHRGPSTPMACELCAGMAATQALKILLGRGKAPAAPWGMHFDTYRNKLALTWRPGGNRHPLQRLGLYVARRRLGRQISQGAQCAIPASETPLTPIEQILDLARWAPSGDNTQPWRFEIPGERCLVVHGFDTREHVIYDLQGRASQLALGGLLETLEIAAQGHGWRCDIRRRKDLPETRPTFDVKFSDTLTEPHPLEAVIRTRVTNRQAFSRRPLSSRERSALEASVGAGYRVLWLEGSATLRQMARLLFANAEIRLTTPEAYTVHKSIIEWNSQFSQERIPDQAVGLDPVALRLMRWAMQSWKRVCFLNRYLGGTLLPRLQLDVWPALNCAAHFVIVAEQPLQAMDDYVTGGRAMQRFWLTATHLGLQFQPEMTPLIFASYIYNDVVFSQQSRSLAQARRLTSQLEALIGREACQQAVYMGRVGFGSAPAARSLRLPLSRLVLPTVQYEPS
ncbi:MAG TPA: ThiF family adenylyltransferase [Candidatus Competibacteraceae bacterium]|nr:ThiF family adenylyltransferase [Gammaproteobacteria bacterium]HPF58802.1 ThiF family adenylyltransferase [Candidatus Competibacteraceae bacterium]